MKTQKEQLMQLGAGLKALRTPYEAHLREIGENFMPRRTRFSSGHSHKSDSFINRQIINARPRLALRTMQSGMQSGMTSPARPWFRLLATDPAMRRDATMKAHLSAAQNEMRQVMQSTGLYNAFHTTWGDLGWSGTDAIILEDDDAQLLRPITLVPGEYWVGANGLGRIDTLYREYKSTIQSIVGKFVYKGNKYGDPDWSVVTSDIKNAWDKGDIGALRDVCQLIYPRADREMDRMDWTNKPIASTYWLHGKNDSSLERLLGNRGYDVNPIIASRWDVEGENVYGSSPAMDALSDAKTLQVQERDIREAIRRMNRPPMNAPVEMRNSGYSLAPEAVNFMADPSKGMLPAYQIQPPIQHLREMSKDIEDRIDEAMYANLFLMISRLQRSEITAREIDERHEEKLISLGPVLERQHHEKLGPVIDRVYNAVLASGRVPPLPAEYADVPVKIDYISLLAQAQKAVATGGIERLYGFLGNLSAADQEVLDLTDNDEAVREYADMLGVPATIMRDEAKVAERREQRRAAVEQESAMQSAAMMAPAVKQGAEAAKIIADTDATGRPVDILRNLGLR
jgi:hypothetical protein